MEQLRADHSILVSLLSVHFASPGPFFHVLNEFVTSFCDIIIRSSSNVECIC